MHWKVVHEVEVDLFCDLVRPAVRIRVVSAVCVVQVAITVQLVPLT
jgi:hypothetical protein